MKSMNNGIRISFFLKFSEIEELIQSEDRKMTTIKLHSGNKLVFTNGHGKRIFKKLFRNRAGENID